MTTRQEDSLHMVEHTNFKRQIVTGGAGFIGSEYVRSALSGKLFGGVPEKVTVIDSLTYAGDLTRLLSVREREEFVFVHADVRDTDRLMSLASSHDAIIHFAAESHVDRSIEHGREFLESNVIGTYSVLESAKEYQIPVVLVSTDEVYGSVSTGYSNEEAQLNPSSPYSASKASGDLLGLAYFRTFGSDVRITRCANNYGKFQNAEKLIPKIVERLTSGQKIPIYGNGQNVRDWLHIEDHCDAIARVLHLGSAGEIYNIGGEESFTNVELAQIFLNYFGLAQDQIQFIEDRLGHDTRYAVDSSKIRNQLGWTPHRRLQETLVEICEGLVP